MSTEFLKEQSRDPEKTSALFVILSLLALLLLTASACRSTIPVRSEYTEHGDEHPDEMPALSPVTLGEGERLRVVATTSIVGDIVQNIGGGLIDLKVLMPLGTDPHSFEPTPQDAATVADAHVVFLNGVGLETFLEPLLENASERATVVSVSYGIELLQFVGPHEHNGEFDPHTWFDPNNAMVWTHNIERTLSTLDPGNARTYQANAEAYEVKLKELDAWIRDQVAQVSEANRKLVTDHMAFSYLAHRYGFEQIGAVFPGYSTLAEPSAQDVAELEDAIRQFDVKAIFVGLTVNPGLAQRVADDTGTQLVSLYTGSLSNPGGPADNYISFMRYNVSAIADALR